MSRKSQQLSARRLGFRTRFARETLNAPPPIFLQGSNDLRRLMDLLVRLMVFRMQLTVRVLRIALVLPAALCCGSPAFAQQLDYVPEVNDMSTVPIGPTSPLGIDSSSVGGTGIPLGATEIPSAGVSPLATYSTGTTALPGSGTTCTTLGTSQSGLTAPTYTYDGGGMAMGSAATATAATAGTATMTSTMATSGSTQMGGISVPIAAPTDPGTLPISGMTTPYAMGTVGVSGMCSAGSSGLATSASTPMSTTATTPGGNPRTGIPLGSWEIANLGVSSWATLPTLSASPFATTTTGTTLPTVATMPVVTTPLSTSTSTTTASTSPTGLLLNVSGIPLNVSGIPVLVPGLASRQ